MAKSQGWRNRVLALETHVAGDILDHPHQWRTHPKAQTDALRGVLEEVGVAGAMLVYRSARAGGALVRIDGHGRKDLDPAAEWPCLVLDVDDREADKLLATYDPISAQAGADATKLDELLRGVSTGSAALQQLLSDVAAKVIPPTTDEWGAAFGSVPDGEKPPFEQMTFTLATHQAETVREALKAAKGMGPFVDTGNENSNGNALARICEAFNGRG